MRKYTREQMIEIMSDDHPDYEVVQDKLASKWRWGTTHRVIVKEVCGVEHFSFLYQLHHEDGLQHIDDGLKKVKVVTKTLVDYLEDE